LTNGAQHLDLGRAVSVDVPKARASVTAKLTPRTIAGAKHASVALRVKVPGTAAPTGSVEVKVGTKVVKVALKAKAKGKIAVTLPKLAVGRYKVTVVYSGTAHVAKKTLTLKDRLRVSP
jgi:hypothetical protein